MPTPSGEGEDGGADGDELIIDVPQSSGASATPPTQAAGKPLNSRNNKKSSAPTPKADEEGNEVDA